MSVSIPSEPINRKEQYLAKIAGQSVEIPSEPLTREEAYLDAIAKGGSGGGGTNDYNDLLNQPSINNTTLEGDMSAEDLGLATEQALAAKQDALTAGDDIKITDGIIAVECAIEQQEANTYEFDLSSSTPPGQGAKVTKKSGNTVLWTEIMTYTDNVSKEKVYDNRFRLVYDNSTAYYTVTLLKDSTDATAGTSYTWKFNNYPSIPNRKLDFEAEYETGSASEFIKDLQDEVSAIKDGASIDSFGDVETALAGKQDTLTFDNAPTENSNNPVKSGGVYSALAGKQNASDNSLQTTDKTIVGAINEHEGDVSTLKNGLTSLGTLHDMLNTTQQDDFVGKYAIIGKICFFSLICTKSQTSYTLGMIEGVLPLLNGVLVAYDSTNKHGVYVAPAGGNNGTLIQISTGVLADKVAVSGCFFIQ